jgi:hypothetical protein
MSVLNTTEENIWIEEGLNEGGGENCIMRSFITCTLLPV